MNVEVTIVVSTPPREEDFDSLRLAAARLTDHPSSITVQMEQTNDRISLITNFTMRTTAQYKVVGDISSQFKFHTFDIEGYEDIIITFPKSGRGD
ncbi:hypothetical protein [Leptolyngbya sp. NIES-2104]|uniref:hypothetical protein n=1 Tax=Leptolyngbya sp. NIES-2104 TaxID=1552121 RepID=UPI0006ECBB1E|nr:hypothetical protein [Leptolyngbya sp. NIES-2104]GAP99743.1 hypothetical protein NIES2104_63090 [Leptolyngbya sp. NIES-2104]